MILRKVLDDEGIEQDVLKNYRSLTIDNILVCVTSYLWNGISESPPDEKILLDLTPGENENHKRIFHKQVFSQMISQRVFGRLDQASINKLMTMKKIFTWKDGNGDHVYDGVAMEFLIKIECNPETKVGVKILRDQISSTKSSAFNNNIADVL